LERPIAVAAGEPQVLLLDNADVERLLDVKSCLDALTRAYQAQAAGTAVDRKRTQTYVELDEPNVSYCLKSMEGAIPGTGLLALRLTSDIVLESSNGGMLRREKIARGPGGTYCGLIVLFSVTALAPVAIIHDGYIQVFRVACTSALGTDLLARKDAGDMGLLGSSGQAWAHLLAMRAMRNLRRVRVYSPNIAHREQFARRARDELALAVEPVGSARDAVSDADLVVLATNASTPIIDGRWLAPGAHVVSIVSGDQRQQRRELDDETMRRAAVVITHSLAVARGQQQGDICEPVARGILKWEDLHDLSELVGGSARGRTAEHEITVFKNNVGLGLQFAAVAGEVYELARTRGIGRALPARWFLQTLVP
jgi:ornithine cyclodeaminase/alanine dehydrogenase-like protein (mu-crystallin family)